MAYTKISSISRYISDTVAELPTDCNAGSTALVDGVNYVFFNSSWIYAPMPTSVSESYKKTVTFQDAVTAIGSGTSLTVGGLKTLTVGIKDTGTSSTGTIEFHAVDPVGNDILLKGMELTGWTSGTFTSSLGTTWIFDISGLVTVYFKITAISGTITVIGKGVA
jgi:hypothetical protein